MKTKGDDNMNLNPKAQFLKIEARDHTVHGAPR